MINFIKKWTLPLAMTLGILGYFVLTEVPQLQAVRPSLKAFNSWLMPSLIFAQLLLSFCKVEPKSLVPVAWHGWLLLFQASMCCLAAGVILLVPTSESVRVLLEGTMICLICPTATAAVVVTGKLGGNTSSLVTYTLLSNILAAILVPIVFPLVEPHEGLTFFAAFLKILGKVFPLLLVPFFLALLFRSIAKPIHRWLLNHAWLAFYLWAIALTIVTGQTAQTLVDSEANVLTKIAIALGGLAACVLQFWFGKQMGVRYGDIISSGQALGQKNTVLAIWIAFAYLNPLAAVGPGSYVIWQNSFNAFQLYQVGKRQAKNTTKIEK